MSQLEIKLDKFKVVQKNEWSKDEAYLWCFGLVIDNNTLRSGNFIIKKKPDQGNLGKGFTKGEERQIPSNVGHITTRLTPINIGDKSVAVGGVIALAWEEDHTPSSKVVQAYDDSVTVLKEHVLNRVRSLNTEALTQAEIDAITADLKKVIEKRFKSAVHWYNPFSWDPDDFIGFAQMIEAIEPNRTVTKAIRFTFAGEGAKYEVRGQLKVTP
jgi:hypothetical protein